MPIAVALLLSEEPALVAAVREATDSVLELGLVVANPAELSYVQLSRADLGLVILQLGRRKGDADEVLRLVETVRCQRRSVAIIVVSDQPNSEMELTLSQQGTAQFLQRPLDVRRLAYLADYLTIRARQRDPGAEQPEVIALGDTEPFLFAPGTQMGNVMEKVLRIAAQDTTVLLTGETGTGKSRLAKLIHELSPRKSQPFQVINCGALSINLVESEIFGHVKGAFTGADRDRTGKCAEVGRGTLVLDEVDTLSLDAQAKLLRLVEDRVFEPVGSNRVLPMQARLIVATNRNLRDEVAQRRFRTDLYYRLNVVEFGLLPLRERLREHPESLAPLVENFLALFAEKAGRKFRGFAPDVLPALQAHSWQGNIREVRNVIEHAVALADGPFITLDDLPAYFRQDRAEATPTPSPHLGADAAVLADGTLADSKEEAEMLRISQALAKFPNNRQRAARELGISRMTLYNKLRRYGL